MPVSTSRRNRSCALSMQCWYRRAARHSRSARGSLIVAVTPGYSVRNLVIPFPHELTTLVARSLEPSGRGSGISRICGTVVMLALGWSPLHSPGSRDGGSTRLCGDRGIGAWVTPGCPITGAPTPGRCGAGGGRVGVPRSYGVLLAQAERRSRRAKRCTGSLSFRDSHLPEYVGDSNWILVPTVADRFTQCEPST
jgi:hypothetical protein